MTGSVSSCLLLYIIFKHFLVITGIDALLPIFFLIFYFFGGGGGISADCSKWKVPAGWYTGRINHFSNIAGLGCPESTHCHRIDLCFSLKLLSCFKSVQTNYRNFLLVESDTHKYELADAQKVLGAFAPGEIIKADMFPQGVAK